MKAVDPTIRIGIDVGDPAKVAWTTEVFSNPGTGRRSTSSTPTTASTGSGAAERPRRGGSVRTRRPDRPGRPRQPRHELPRRPGEIEYYMGEFNITQSYHSTRLRRAGRGGDARRDDRHGLRRLALARVPRMERHGGHGLPGAQQPRGADPPPYANYFVYWLFARNWNRALVTSSLDPEVVVHAGRFASGESRCSSTRRPRGHHPAGRFSRAGGQRLGPERRGPHGHRRDPERSRERTPLRSPLPETVPTLISRGSPGSLSDGLEPPWRRCSSTQAGTPRPARRGDVMSRVARRPTGSRDGDERPDPRPRRPGGEVHAPRCLPPEDRVDPLRPAVEQKSAPPATWSQGARSSREEGPSGPKRRTTIPRIIRMLPSRYSTRTLRDPA